MGAAYYIVLDNADPGFDAFVNGKAIASDVRSLSKIASSLGLKTPDDYFSLGGDEAASVAEEFGVELDDGFEQPAEEWYEADEGIEWARHLRSYLESHPESVKDAAAVLADLEEYEQVLLQAKGIGAKWHLGVDY